MKRGSHQRVGEILMKEFDDIRIKRIIKGLDKPTKQISFRAMTDILPKHTSWNKIKEDLINLESNKIRGVNR